MASSAQLSSVSSEIGQLSSAQLREFLTQLSSAQLSENKAKFATLFQGVGKAGGAEFGVQHNF